MEDTHYLDTDFNGNGWVFGGIYDGHSGKYAAIYTASVLHRKFLLRLSEGLHPQDAFIKSYEQVSQELSNQESGTTAVNFLIRDNIIYTANVGDAGAIVIGKKSVIQLTVGHRVDDSNERKRVEKAGGLICGSYVIKGDVGLMPTRSLGDEYFKNVGVIATPSVNEYQLTSNDVILLAACDGLFDFISNAEIAMIARKTPDINLLLGILKNEVLYNRYGTDNLTVIAVDLIHRS